MSIFSDHDCGALSDFEFEQEKRRMNRIDRDKLTEVMEEMCDNYCIYPRECSTQECLDEHCAECPLNNIGEEE